MKKSIFMGLVAILGLIGCTRNQEIDIQENGLTLFARTESPADTKTVVEEGVHVFWEPGDEIAVFMGEKMAKFSTDITAASGTATFKGTFGDESWPEELDLWAVYPYSEEAVFDGETITTVLPSEQVAREGSFGKDMNLSIAHSTGTALQFYNVGGGIRFSVTEEGIKKVMFEGLSGEIISGKVKIGFDENGTPVVKEVSGGSQFITLLPPAGKETFEPGTWYYIVAIPGTLEGGYKLRFYKNSDYARKVSEKAVEIKRSIYGNLERADEGIEYEATTTKFPETEEELIESVQLTHEIGSIITSVINDADGDVNIIANEVLRIDGVSNVEINPNSSGIAIRQKDGLWFNCLISPRQAYEESLSDTWKSSSVMPRASSIYGEEDNSIISCNCDAIILNPFKSSFGTPISKIVSNLKEAGVSTLEYPNQKANILLFKGDNLQKYGLIIIDTHGSISYNAKEPEGERMYWQTIVASGTEYDAELVTKYIDDGDLTWDDIAILQIGEKFYLSMNTNFLQQASFDQSIVITTACSSTHILGGDSDVPGATSLAQAFTDKGASFFSGYDGTIHDDITSIITEKLILYLSHGFAFKESVDYLINSDEIQAYREQSIARAKAKGTSENGLYSIDHHLFRAIDNKKNNGNPVFLVTPHPSSLNRTLDGGEIFFSWTSRLKYFVDSWKIGDNNVQNSLFAFYEVFVNDERIATSIITNDDNQYSISYSLQLLKASDSYDWYVVTGYKKGSKVVVSYKSYGKSFTVSGLPSASIQTNDPTNIGPCSAEIPFSISTDENVYGYGIVYSTNISNPTADNHGDGNYIMPVSSDVGNSIVISTLMPNTTYYARAFITLNEENGIKLYGNTIQFTTKGLSFNSQYEDLGLSVKWATCNLGSSTPNNVGGFYRWGETSVRSSSNEKYKWGVFPNYTKYNASDGKTTLEASDDAAHVNLGEKWRMPTNDELTELRNSCTWTQTIKNGVRGCTVTGPNGNSIFIPISGGNKGYYHADVLSSSLSINPDDASRYVHALSYAYDENFVYFLRTYRDGGTPIRPVYDDGTQIPHVSFSPSSYAFGDVSVGETATSQAFTFTNSGSATLNVTVESCPDGFTTTPNVGGSFPVKAGDSRTGFVIRFSPKQAKAYSGTVVLSTNDPNNPQLYIPVSGKGISSQAAEPLITVSPDSYDFGSVTVGQYVRTTITIKNTGTADLEVNTIRLLDGSQGFDLGTSASSGTVSPGGTKSFGVRFLPQSKGYAADQILIKSNASNNSSKLVTLTGTGI